MKSEAKIQSEIFLYFWNNYPDLRRVFFHIPNGGKRTVLEAMKFKSMGVVRGIPDMFFAVPRNGYHGLFIEVKKPGEKIKSDGDQERCAKALEVQGYKCVVFDSSEESIKYIENYLFSNS